MILMKNIFEDAVKLLTAKNFFSFIFDVKKSLASSKDRKTLLRTKQYFVMWSLRFVHNIEQTITLGIIFATCFNHKLNHDKLN